MTNSIDYNFECFDVKYEKELSAPSSSPLSLLLEGDIFNNVNSYFKSLPSPTSPLSSDRVTAAINPCLNPSFFFPIGESPSINSHNPPA